MQLSFALQIMVSSLAFGSMYALVALGIVFIWKSMSVLNFAHGHLLMLGGYIAFVWLHTGLEWPLWAAALVTLLIVGTLGIVFSKTVFERLRKEQLLSKVVATMGLGLIIVNTVLLVFGTRPRAFAGFLGRQTIMIGNVRVLGEHLLALGVTLGVLFLLGLLLKYTMVGKVIRAIAYDRETTGLMGVPAPRYLHLTFAFAVLLAGLAGVFIVPVTFLTYQLGEIIGYKGFAAIVVGGFGTIPGAIVGGYLVGLMEGAGVLLLGSQYRDAVAAVLVILVLLLRPRGLFGGEEAKRL